MSCAETIPQSFKAGADACAATLANFDNVLLAAHVNMDGDALGSLAASGFILQNLGRNFALFSSSGVPHYLNFLTLPGPVYRTLAELPFKPQNAIYLDCNDVARLGNELAEKALDWPSINIDHHIGGRGLGSIVSYIDPKAAATAQLVAYVAMALKMPLKDKLADAIALGLMTDTGGFCHGNTTAEVFELCAVLASNGCRLNELREELQNSWSLGRLRLWGELFTKLEMAVQHRIAVSTVTQADFERHHCTVEDLEGLIDRFRKIRGVKVTALIREENRERCKFSLRSYGPIDVRQMAAIFGGGGHLNAAGGNISASLNMAKAQLIEVITQMLRKQL